MSKRLRELRKKRGLGQEEFGKGPGVTKAAVSKTGLDAYQITDVVLKLMYSGFNVNEKWLRSGERDEGDIFIKPQKNDLITRATQLLGEKDLVFEAFIATCGKLSPSSREVLLEFGLEFLSSLDIPDDN